jgi:hypothetical protein
MFGITSSKNIGAIVIVTSLALSSSSHAQYTYPGGGSSGGGGYTGGGGGYTGGGGQPSTPSCPAQFTAERMGFGLHLGSDRLLATNVPRQDQMPTQMNGSVPVGTGTPEGIPMTQIEKGKWDVGFQIFQFDLPSQVRRSVPSIFAGDGGTGNWDGLDDPGHTIIPGLPGLFGGWAEYLSQFACALELQQTFAHGLKTVRYQYTGTITWSSGTYVQQSGGTMNAKVERYTAPVSSGIMSWTIQN